MFASFTTVMAALALTTSAPTAVKWESDYGKALAQTKSDSRPLLVVIDNSSVESQQVPESLLTTTDENAPLAKYDLCHVDVTTEYGKAVAKVFRATEYPYLAIIDKSGSVILHRHAGKVTAEGWNATLVKHQRGARAQRVTVAKPVIQDATSPVSLTTQPVSVGGSYYEATPSSYYATPVNSYCPNCQRR